MSPPWFTLLEWIGRIRLRLGIRPVVSVGDPRMADARGGTEWQEYVGAEPLFRVWGPLEGSPWEPFHCVPLFAALDRIPRKRVGPTSPEERPQEWKDGRIRVGTGLGNRDTILLPDHARPGAPPPSWARPGSWVLLDLPGPAAVEAAVWLILEGGFQPVCTFDHWPHPRGVLRPERILAELLRWASTVEEARGRLTADAPPLWICDSRRLGTRKGTPGEFDNRYFLDDSILPGRRLLLSAGIRRVIYISSAGAPGSPVTPGTPPEGEIPTRDLEAYFTDLLSAGLEVFHVPIGDPELRPRPFSAPPSPRPPPRRGFRRSAAGGFGAEVPQPSSGGSSG